MSMSNRYEIFVTAQIEWVIQLLNINYTSTQYSNIG